jgi:aryl carrier-like protein
VLGGERVGAHSNFIELGGDSITAMRVADGLEARFGARITFGQILAATTLAGVAGVVDELTRR